jgi:hypothetical protein
MSVACIFTPEVALLWANQSAILAFLNISLYHQSYRVLIEHAAINLEPHNERSDYSRSSGSKNNTNAPS